MLLKWGTCVVRRNRAKGILQREKVTYISGIEIVIEAYHLSLFFPSHLLQTSFNGDQNIDLLINKAIFLELSKAEKINNSCKIKRIVATA